MNKVILFGRLTKDIELKRISDNFFLANSAIVTSRKFKDKNGETKEETMFIDLAFYGKAAETAAKFFRKGNRILVEGRLKFNQWVAQDGTSRSKHIIEVETYKIVDSRKENQAATSVEVADEEIPF